MKTLKQILEVYSPKSADEKRFVKKHITVKTADVAGNGDDVYSGAKVKAIDRKATRKGYSTPDSESVYEEEQIDELKKSTVGSYIQKKFAKMSDEPASKNPNEIFAKKDARGIKGASLRMSGIKATQKEEIKVYEEFKDINDPLIEEMLNEVLAKDAKAADYISDFVKSDDPKFAGKSKAKRIQMALGAYYSKQKGE
jgi:hypothetical protein